jgi:alpha-1,6-mannosyltransferase
MLTILDVNNSWSPTGGGVRRYQLEKMRHFSGREGVHYIFVMPGDETRTERHAPGVTIEHLESTSVPGTGAYRHVVRSGGLREILQRHRPDVIECGSPWIMPILVERAVARLDYEPATVGFWHADFPRAYVGRFFKRIHRNLEEPSESAGWWWARRHYGRFDGIFVASRWVGDNMRRHGLERLYYTPLGVDTDLFDPARRDPELVEELRAGQPERASIFFPHRFSDEKGLKNLLRAYRRIVRTLPHEPALVFAGTGPDQELVERAAREYEHVRFLGFLDSPEAMARWYASCDLAVALSAFETFGLSTAEAMASGLAIVAADEGAAGELVRESDCGHTVPFGDSVALADALVDLIGEGKTRERGARARRHVERFEWSTTFETELACYREIVECRSRGEQVPAGFHDRRVNEG